MKKHSRVPTCPRAPSVPDRVSMLKGVPVLTYGEDNNLREVTRCLSNYSSLHFGPYAPSVESLKALRTKKVIVDPRRYKNDLLYRKKKDLALGARQTKKALIVEMGPKMYHGILSILSADGEEAARRHPDFSDAEES